MSTKEINKGKMKVRIYESTEAMGSSAAEFVSDALNKAISERNSANLILATGASQFTFLKQLKKEEIEWDKVTVFHLDEYVGMPESHPASFRKYLKERIINEVKPGKAYFLNGDVEDVEKEAQHYEDLLKDHPVDIACIGIGENGHIAFNDPGVADFRDPRLVKIADLDLDCRQQQLGEGWFDSLEEVPAQALSLTIPAIMSCKSICCVVPGKRKARIMKETLSSEISTACPATILRRHDSTVVFLDQESASEL